MDTRETTESLEETIKLLQQIVFEDEQSRKNVRKKVVEDIKGTEGLEDIYTACRIAINKYISGDYYDSKNKRIAHIKSMDTQDIVIEMAIAVMPFNVPTPIQVVATNLAYCLEYKDIFDGIKTASEILAVCVETGLYNIAAPGTHMEGLSIYSLYSLEQKTWDFIMKTKFKDPMIVEPIEWTNNFDGGYITINDGVLLGKAHHNDKQCLDALNIIQGIELELDPAILNMVETSNKPLDTVEKIEAHNQMIRNSNVSYKNILSNNNSFYFCAQFDFRGRIYTHGYHINLQGSKYKKALISTKRRQIIKCT